LSPIKQAYSDKKYKQASFFLGLRNYLQKPRSHNPVRIGFENLVRAIAQDWNIMHIVILSRKGFPESLTRLYLAGAAFATLSPPETKWYCLGNSNPGRGALFFKSYTFL
jgi:hypothetical protein